MPPKSEKQRKLMQAVAHSPKLARKLGISKATAKKVLGKHGKAKRKRP